MTETVSDEPKPMAGRETYTWGHDEIEQRVMSSRTAAEWAAFFLPHLRSGMRLLDCGCGPGAITLGLAEAVAPAEVVGVDIWPANIERAVALAAERAVPNVSFRVGSVYELSFPDASFDAVFAANLLEHLSDPLRALKEMRRVLKPGGVVGVWDPDWSTMWVTPPSGLLEESIRLILRAREANGGSPTYTRHLRRLLLEAGFDRAEAAAVALHWGAPKNMPGYFAAMAYFLTELPAVRDVIVGEGWADQARLEAMAAEWRAWGERPDALLVLLNCTAVGRVAERS